MTENGRKKIAADLCSYIDKENETLHMEISIPGVDKDNIHLKFQNDSFSLTAPRGDIEYVTTGTFCCPVKSTASKAIYENGLLKIDVPFLDPWEGAHEVRIE